MKKTILYEKHLALNAKMISFGGYEMPIQYESIIKEHQACRSGAVIFDTCHMGVFRISGNSAVSDLEQILSCNVADIKIGTCRYGLICNEKGGVIDDQIIYRICDGCFLMVVNASAKDCDYEWIKNHIGEDTIFEDVSAQNAKIDLQGPLAPKILSSILEDSVGEIKYYHFTRNYYGENNQVLISRTGYTGEIGFEIYATPELISKLWDECISRGAVPAGLGARDTLRIEMGFPLYGHELSADRNAAQSGLTRAVSRTKKFIGSDAILNASSDLSEQNQLMVGIALEGRRSARHNDIIADESGNEIGIITSGVFSPTLGHAIALGYVNKEYSQAGKAVKIINGKNELCGKINELPFYKNGTARTDITNYL